ncbi:permease [uncultured Cohaesibacter sp.]|uniref:permease n=1 Tax=uncultured Cohaesibacter sp. TaxID=1002546 RepID=UPI00292F5B11|nr:permease [uncultured Cohaesibacter sp.]
MLSIFTKLADLITYVWLGLDPTTSLAKSTHFFVEDVTKIFFLTSLIIFLVGLFRTMLTPERVKEFIGGRPRYVSYPLAVGLGSVTPFCSCSSVPLFIGFLESGIPLGVTMAFLIASPMINEVAVVILAAAVGWKVALLYVLAGLTVGIIGGVLIERLKLEKWVEEYVWQIRMGKSALPAGRFSWKKRMRFAWGQVKEIVGRIWIYVLIGIGLGAILHGFVPQDFFVSYASSSNPFAVPIAVLAGIPLYSNATGVIPVIEALMAKGVPLGTLLALMMSVAAISLPEMIILRKVLKPKLIATFVSILFVAFILVGYGFNFLLT